MVRAPCCEKMGLKKGPWTPEEDQILVSYIHKHGHGNWRALPKQAGLLRCGKSCRLRWINYLRPDIKRGNFTLEEEETIIKLHELLGNRWSAIAARLPGRTDNEIKNVWHTHLKKRIKQHSTTTSETKGCSEETQQSQLGQSTSSPISPQRSLSDTSILTVENSTTVVDVKDEQMTSEADDGMCSEALSSDATKRNSMPSPNNEENMDFWFNLFMQLPDLTELPEF